MVDLRQLAIATLWKKYEKSINNEETKRALRNNEETKFKDYAKITLRDYTTSKYSDEDQAKIDKFIAEQGFKKITETKENYSVEIIPSEKAINEFNKMLDELENSQHRNIAKVASQVKNKV